MTEYEAIKRARTVGPVPRWCMTHEATASDTKHTCHHYDGVGPECDVRELYVKATCRATYKLCPTGYSHDCSFVTLPCASTPGTEHKVHTAIWRPNGSGYFPEIVVRWTDDD